MAPSLNCGGKIGGTKVGAGLSGSVIAERITRILKKKVLILEKRNHIGGNCYDYIDKDTGIRLNKYGAHLFHTNYNMF